MLYIVYVFLTIGCTLYVHIFCPCCSQLLQLWEKNGYFDEVTIQQLQSPALGLGQYQVHSPIEAYQALSVLTCMVFGEYLLDGGTLIRQLFCLKMSRSLQVKCDFLIQ